MHFDPHFSPSLYSLGTLLVSAACFTLFVLPSDYDENLAPEEADGGPQLGMLDALKVPSIALAAYSILCASSSIGFLLTSLEPHMRQFDLTPLVMGKECAMYTMFSVVLLKHRKRFYKATTISHRLGYLIPEEMLSLMCVLQGCRRISGIYFF